jgi:hypothetical protein
MVLFGQTSLKQKMSCKSAFKGRVSPDIVFYFKVYKSKSVLSVRPLMVFQFVYFVIL